MLLYSTKNCAKLA